MRNDALADCPGCNMPTVSEAEEGGWRCLSCHYEWGGESGRALCVREEAMTAHEAKERLAGLELRRFRQMRQEIEAGEGYVVARAQVAPLDEQIAELKRIIGEE